MRIIKIVAKGLALSCLIVLNSYATIIKVNGNDVDVLDLNATGVISFQQFYNGGNTGYTASNTVVMLLAELGGEIALITTANKNGEGVFGKLNLLFSGTEGGMSFVDEASEQTGNEINWIWGAGYVDGAIYSGLTSDTWSLDFDFEAKNGINAFSFLTEFDGSGVATDSISGTFPNASFNIFSIANNPSSIVSAPAPASISLLGIALILLTSRRFLK
jgi:hypothetical protein